jgi:purine-binding chemotaxis protein CheW
MSKDLLAEKTKGLKDSHVETSQYLTFALGGEVYAMSIDHVREIIEFDGLTTVPMMPPFLRGVINLRGAVVPVIDLNERFGRERTEIGRRTCVVIVEIEQGGETSNLGVMVDAVNEVVEVDRSRLEARPSFGTDLRQDFIEGILDLGGRFLVVLEVRQVLSVNELSNLIDAGSQVRAPLVEEEA